MNKPALLFFSLLFIAFQGIAQKEISVLTNSKVVGENLLTGEPIRANEYTFPERIHDFQVDTVNNYLTIQLRNLSKNGKWLRNKGHVVRFDVDENRVLWSKKIAFQSSDIQQYGGVTLQTRGGKSYCLNNETGEELWEVKNSLIFADPINQIGIGYKIQVLKGRENLLEGIDLRNGLPLWQREISREYSWNDVFYINDSTLLISASGLHTVNIFDGTGWDYNTVTGKKDYTASAVGTGLGIAAGLLTGTFVVSTGHDLVREIASNVITDSLNIYFASKEFLVKLSKEGEVIWQKPLPDDLTSKSRIFKSDENIVMVNSGYAYMGYRQINFGTPFIVSFDISNGDQKYFLTVSDRKKEIIKSMDLNDEELLFVYNDHVSKYSFNDGQLIVDQSFNNEELNYFIGDQVFVQRDSLFLSLPQTDSAKHHLYTQSGKVLILDSELKTEREIQLDDFYIYYLNKDDRKFIAKDNQTYVINKNGRKTAELSASGRSKFLNGKLFDAQESSFLEIDLGKITDRGP